MARKENIRRGPVGLITYEDGTDAVNDHLWNEHDNPICIVPGCSKAVHNKGEGQGGYQKKCKEHLGLTGKNSYKKHKFEVPYCENIDERLGISCTTTIHHPSMLTVDHIDQDHNNDEKYNLQTLCTGCHAYKGNVIGHKLKSKKISLNEMLEYFEINKRIKKGTHTLDDVMRRHELDKILDI